MLLSLILFITPLFSVPIIQLVYERTTGKTLQELDLFKRPPTASYLKEYQDRLKQFQRFYEDSQDQLQQKDAQLTRKILIELRKVIASLGREDGYTIILEKGESNILYATDSIDLTAEVVRRYNESRKQP